MTEGLRRMAGAVANMISRGKVVSARLSPRRTVMQARVLQMEVKDGLELILPYGMSALPLAGDLVVLAVAGVRDHQVALGADDPALRIADLQAGEFGFRDARGQQVVFRLDRVEITTPLKLVATVTGDVDVTTQANVNLTASGTVTVTAPAIKLGSSGEALHELVTDTMVALFNGHTHPDPQGGSTGTPSTPMGAAQLTSVVTAG